MDSGRHFYRLLQQFWSPPVILLTITLLLLHENNSIGQALQNPSKEEFELFDVSLEDLLNIGIVSASKKTQSVSDAPATAYVITRDQIITRGYYNLSELLEDIPEFEVQRNSNAEYRNIFSVRGVSGNEKFLILLTADQPQSV